MRPVFGTTSAVELACIECGSLLPLACDATQCGCGGLLEVRHPPFSVDMPARWAALRAGFSLEAQSGVWRFGSCVVPMDRHHIVSHPEGNTRIYHRAAFARFTGVDNIGLKHEGENPTGSFKDRGMTVAVSQARALGRKVLGCASTGNTSAALAAYAAQAEEMQALVFLPAGKVAPGKLAQAIAYGAKVVAVEGDFDAAMGLVKLASSKLGIYLVNSVNPFRLEGQKSVMWEMLEQLEWKVPDWVVVPGGNLGNTSAFGKALLEAYHAGWINRLPRIAVVQAAGASPFHRAFQNGFENFVAAQAETIATAIRIGNPVNFSKAFRVIQDLQGVVTAVTDPEILTAKSVIDGCGVGCEPASACSLAGVRKLVQQGVIKPHEQVIGVLTGHILKDPESVALSRNLPAGSMEADVVLSNNLEPLERFLQKS